MIDPNNLQTINAGPLHGCLAVAQIPFIQRGDTQALAAQASAHGFQCVAQDQYVHADGSWIAQLNGSIERGFQQVRLQGRLAAIAQTPMAGAGTIPDTHAALKVVHTSSADMATYTASLTSLGFSAALTTQSATYYSHPDSSWVAVVNGQPLVGVGLYRVDATSFKVPFQPGQAYHELPSRMWSWWRDDPRLQIGNMPFLQNNQAARDELVRRGFQRSPDMNGNERWDHPYCGTWVEFPHGRGPVLGWHKWHLGALPFNDRIAGY